MTPVALNENTQLKANLAGRPIISGGDSPTERISSFVDNLLQPIMKEQQSYLKDTTHFINIVEGTIVPKNTILVSMDVTSLYTNIPQEEGITTISKAYDIFYKNNPPIPTNYLKEMLRLIPQENSFNLSENTTFRLTAPQWEQKWRFPSPIFLWQR